MSSNPGAGANGQASRPPDDRGQRRRSGQWGPGRSGNARGQERAPQRPTIKKFIGKEGGLGDKYVYQLTSGTEASDQYARTTEEIIRYLSTKYKRGGDVERSLTDGTKLAMPIPSTPIGGTVDGVAMAPTEAAMQVWKMQVNMVLQRQ
jgi:hypothetical protein